MNIHTSIILLCFILGLSFNVSCQIPQAEKNNTFPESWLGNWVGDLNIYKENKLVQTIPMELELLAIDTSDNYIWAIIYGEDRETGRRSYELEIVDAEKGLYRIDEKNSIKIEAYLFGNKFYSQFSVMESQILCTYEKIGENMIFEITSGSTKPVSITGGKIIDEEEIPEVKTYPISIKQKAVLSFKN